MDDTTQNTVCDTQIKEEYLEDFSEITNHNIQINQKDNVTSKIENNFVKCEKQSHFQPIKVENDNLCNYDKASLQDQYINSNQVEIKQEKLNENIK